MKKNNLLHNQIPKYTEETSYDSNESYQTNFEEGDSGFEPNISDQEGQENSGDFSTSNASLFLSEALKYEGAGKEISKIINETDRNCYHFEIPQ